MGQLPLYAVPPETENVQVPYGSATSEVAGPLNVPIVYCRPLGQPLSARWVAMMLCVPLDACVSP